MSLEQQACSAGRLISGRETGIDCTSRDINPSIDWLINWRGVSTLSSMQQGCTSATLLRATLQNLLHYMLFVCLFALFVCSVCLLNVQSIVAPLRPIQGMVCCWIIIFYGVLCWNSTGPCRELWEYQNLTSNVCVNIAASAQPIFLWQFSATQRVLW